MALAYVDPNAEHSPVRKAYSAFMRTPAGRWFAINIASRADPFLLNHSGGKVGFGLMIPTAVLETTGAKSGAPRQNPIVYFHDGDDAILVASSFGRDKHPAWFHNLKAHPDCVLGGERFTAAEVEDPAEHKRLFDGAISVYGGYADYKKRTEAIGRHIPIMRLVPR
jgi:deazaflavin-dependent oxidoreductase (nitroreductase family)